MDRRVERGQVTRARLIAAARELFGEHGYDGTSIEAILRKSGIARGALYHHFASKEELFDAVLDREIALVAEIATKAALEQKDPVESLRAGCATWLRGVLDPAVQRILLLDAQAVVGWQRFRELDELHTLGGLRANVRRLAADGKLPRSQVNVIANMIAAAVDEAALLIAQSDDQRAALRTGLAAVDTLIDRLFG